MNNIVNMVSYYLIHKNADDSVVEYLKSKIDNSNVEDLIIIQIELLYTDPTDKLVSNLVNYINNKINDILININLKDLISLISILKNKIEDKNNENKLLDKKNKEIFEKIKTKDLNKDNEFNDEDSKIASELIEESKNNEYIINRNKSEINSINIWLINLENSLNKKIDTISIEDLFYSYIEELTMINRDDFINSYINKTSNKIEDILLKSDLLETITEIMPELNRIYNNNSKDRNELYKLLDYYIDLVDGDIKRKISKLGYEEKLVLKDKINVICFEILHNESKDDDFKVMIIKSYLKYL